MRFNPKKFIGSSFVFVALFLSSFAFAQAVPTGPAAMQASSAQAARADGRSLDLTRKVEELAKLQKANNSRNNSRISALRREIDTVKRNNCEKAPDYLACLQHQNELERMHIKTFENLMSGCYDEPGSMTAEGVTVGGARKCPDGRGILNNPDAMKGNLNLTTIRTASGAVITNQQWSHPSSTVTKADLDSGFSLGKLGVYVGSCTAGFFAGGWSGGRIGGALSRDEVVVENGKDRITQGGADLGWAIGGPIGCLGATYVAHQAMKK